MHSTYALPPPPPPPPNAANVPLPNHNPSLTSAAALSYQSVLDFSANTAPPIRADAQRLATGLQLPQTPAFNRALQSNSRSYSSPRPPPPYWYVSTSPTLHRRQSLAPHLAQCRPPVPLLPPLDPAPLFLGLQARARAGPQSASDVYRAR